MTTQILDRHGHLFDKRTHICIKCGAKYWEVVAEVIKAGKPH